ncbi:MAG: ribosome assembly RNA-binding protein YhbY [Erysipelotrichaceae bacterium]
MLDTKKKKQLRTIAHSKSALFQVGKEGISENLIKTIGDSLEAHELIKISLLKTCPINVREAAYDLAGNTHSEIVQIIGRTCVLYRRSKKNKLEM